MHREPLSRRTHWEGLKSPGMGGVKPGGHEGDAVNDVEADSLLVKQSLSTWISNNLVFHDDETDCRAARG